MSERDQKPQEAAARPPCTCGERDMRERDYRRLSDLMFRLEGDAERWQEEAERARAALTTEKDSAYHQRNMLVGLLSKLYPSWINADPNEPDWPVVLIQLPTGQVSWHITYQQRYSIFAHIYGESGPPWDGHDDVEKWRRVCTMLGPATP